MVAASGVRRSREALYICTQLIQRFVSVRKFILLFRQHLCVSVHRDQYQVVVIQKRLTLSQYLGAQR